MTDQIKFLVVTVISLLHSVSCQTVEKDSLCQVHLPKLDFSSEGETYQIWVNDSQCSHFTTRFTKKYSLDPLALVSFPGSGNTWLRYLIEGATGVFTGSTIFKGSGWRLR